MLEAAVQERDAQLAAAQAALAAATSSGGAAAADTLSLHEVCGLSWAVTMLGGVAA